MPLYEHVYLARQDVSQQQVDAMTAEFKQLIEEGKQFGTTLQSPLHEGQLAIKMVEEYLNTGKLANYINFTPNPSVTKDTIETTALRGYDGKLYTIEELCSGAWAD